MTFPVPLRPPTGVSIVTRRSVRINALDNAIFSRTAGAPTNAQKFTIACWYKRAGDAPSNGRCIIGSNGGTGGNAFLALGGSDFNGTFETLVFGTSGNVVSVGSTQLIRDRHAWYHLVIAVDTTQAAAANRLKMYINGAEVTSLALTTYPALNAQIGFNSNGSTFMLGYIAGYYADGYFSDVYFIDGQQLLPTSFGKSEPSTGAWVPIVYTGTYGNNGGHWTFEDNSAATASTIGKDYSGNGNNLTPSNISITAGIGNDSFVDVPQMWGTDTGAGGEVRGNYPTLSPMFVNSVSMRTITNGNLDVTFPSSINLGMAIAPFELNSTNKFYWELTVTAAGGIFTGGGIVVTHKEPGPSEIYGPGFAGDWGYGRDGRKWVLGVGSAYGATFTTNDVIGFLWDQGSLTCYKNGVSQGVLVSGLTGTYFPQAAAYLSGAVSMNFGQRPFAFAAPTGGKALCTHNLPTPAVLKPTNYAKAALHTGNGAASRSLTGLADFQPDFIWIKARSQAYDHIWQDAVRGFGTGKKFGTARNETENGGSFPDTLGYVSAANASGFDLATTSAMTHVNENGTTYMDWLLKEGVLQGLDIITYTGTGVSGRTVAHNLGAVPHFIIIKSRSIAANWLAYHRSLGPTAGIFPNLSDALNTHIAYFNNTAPTSSVFTVDGASGHSQSNQNGVNYVAYAFTEVAGFSRFSEYLGNGLDDGPFVYCGFRPAMVIMKRVDAAGENWLIYDNARDPYNPASKPLQPNNSFSEGGVGSYPVDFLSNGVKFRQSTYSNTSNGRYIFAAFAEMPFKYARAR